MLQNFNKSNRFLIYSVTLTRFIIYLTFLGKLFCISCYQFFLIVAFVCIFSYISQVSVNFTLVLFLCHHSTGLYSILMCTLPSTRLFITSSQYVLHVQYLLLFFLHYFQIVFDWSGSVLFKPPFFDLLLFSFHYFFIPSVIFIFHRFSLQVYFPSIFFSLLPLSRSLRVASRLLFSNYRFLPNLSSLLSSFCLLLDLVSPWLSCL